MKPFLITGSHKSGKSFVARGIAVSDTIVTIYEPLNCNTRIGLNGLKVNYWYQHINGNDEEFRKEFSDTLQFKYRYGKQLKAIKSPGEVRKVLRDIINMNALRKQALTRTPMIDDPFAVFSAEWFHKNFSMPVIILIRHPASFISSLKLKNREHPFSHFTQQPSLMQSHLQPFKEEILEYTSERKSIIEQGILLWRLIYHTVNKYKGLYEKEWLFLRLEDFAPHPMDEFRKVYEYLGIDFTPGIHQKLESYLRSGNISNPELPAGTFEMGRYEYAIEAQKDYYKNFLSPQEVDVIKEKTKDVWQHFYTDNDW
jgi:hypothetical protein